MLILASASKARRRLLEQAGIPHKVMISGFDEESIKHSDPGELVQLLAIEKAKTITFKLLNEIPETIFPNKASAVLGCDSVFEFEGKIYGKPQNKKQALERWELMSSKQGILHTGHALFFNAINPKEDTNSAFNKLIHGVVSTSITFSNLSQKEIEKYVNTGEPLNCAGGFALEGKGGMLIKSLNGCYSNVIGISLPWLREAFLQAGIEQ